MHVLSVLYMLLCLIFASFVQLVYLLHYEVDGMPAMHLTQCCIIFASFVQLVYLLHYEVDGMSAMHLTQCCMFVGTKRTLKSNM